jgi:hypothetical protein
VTARSERALEERSAPFTKASFGRHTGDVAGSASGIAGSFGLACPAVGNTETAGDEKVNNVVHAAVAVDNTVHHALADRVSPIWCYLQLAWGCCARCARQSVRLPIMHDVERTTKLPQSDLRGRATRSKVSTVTPDCESGFSGSQDGARSR